MEMEIVDYAAWIGVDWGSYKHAICLQASGCSSVERCTLEQKPEALHSWFMNLHTRFGGRKVAVAIEQTRGAVIHFLLGFDFVHVFRIHPKSLKNYRDALHPSGAKDDPTDAELLLQFAMLHRDKVKPWLPDEPEIRLLGPCLLRLEKSGGKNASYGHPNPCLQVDSNHLSLLERSRPIQRTDAHEIPVAEATRLAGVLDRQRILRLPSYLRRHLP